MNGPACVSKTTGARVPLKYEMFPPAYSYLPDGDGKSQPCITPGAGTAAKLSLARQGESANAANFRAGGRQNLKAVSAKS